MARWWLRGEGSRAGAEEWNPTLIPQNEGWALSWIPCPAGKPSFPLDEESCAALGSEGGRQLGQPLTPQHEHWLLLFPGPQLSSPPSPFPPVPELHLTNTPPTKLAASSPPPDPRTCVGFASSQRGSHRLFLPPPSPSSPRPSPPSAADPRPLSTAPPRGQSRPRKTPHLFPSFPGKESSELRVGGWRGTST